MKKIVMIIMIIFSALTFSEKLTTDGKLHLDKLLGSWNGGEFDIYKENNKLFLSYNTDGIEATLTPLKNKSYVLKSKDDFDYIAYYAFDTKYKTLVEIDKNLNIVEKIPKRNKEMEELIEKCTPETCN